MSNLAIHNQNYNLESLKQSLKEHVVILSDTSYSMAAPFDENLNRAEALVESIKALINTSDPRRTDYTLAHFSRRASILIPRTNKYTKILFKLVPMSDGGTNMHDGLLLALEAQPNRVILLSDGEPDSTSLVRTIITERYIPASIKVDTIGIGDFSTIMKEIAEMTGGKYTAATNLKQLKEAYKALETKLYYLTHQES